MNRGEGGVQGKECDINPTPELITPLTTGWDPIRELMSLDRVSRASGIGDPCCDCVCCRLIADFF